MDNLINKLNSEYFYESWFNGYSPFSVFEAKPSDFRPYSSQRSQESYAKVWNQTTIPTTNQESAKFKIGPISFGLSEGQNNVLTPYGTFSYEDHQWDKPKSAIRNYA